MSDTVGIEMVGYRVLVRPDDVETVSSGGIVLALDEKMEKHGQVRGTVLGYGPLAWKGTDLNENGAPCGEPWVNVGDHILYSKFGGKVVIDPTNGEELLVMNDVDVLARVE